jgi:hypothetical protein
VHIIVRRHIRVHVTCLVVKAVALVEDPAAGELLPGRVGAVEVSKQPLLFVRRHKIQDQGHARDIQRRGIRVRWRPRGRRLAGRGLVLRGDKSAFPA